MKIHTVILITVFVGVLLFPMIASAEIWRLSLFFDGSIMREDRERDSVIETIEGRTLHPSSISSDDTGYTVAILSEGIEMYQQSVPVPGQPGVLTVDIPHMPSADRIEVTSQGQRSAEIDVSDQRTCFPNNICEFERGENEQTCPSDCLFQDTIQYSSATQQTLATQNGVIRDEAGTVLLELREPSDESVGPTDQGSQSGLGVLPLIAGLILIMGGLGYWIYTKVHHR